MTDDRYFLKNVVAWFGSNVYPNDDLFTARILPNDRLTYFWGDFELGFKIFDSDKNVDLISDISFTYGKYFVSAMFYNCL